MKRITITQIALQLLFLFSFAVAFAQVQGKIYDNKGTSLPYTNVILMNATDSSFVKGSVTDPSGNFLINNIPNGKYFLSISSIGYRKMFTNTFFINTETKAKTFDDLSLEEEATYLEGVEVRAQKVMVEQNPEGMVVNVENSIMTKGSSALQLIERSPGVVLDQRNNTLTLNGQSGTLIMINGRPVRMSAEEITNLLKGMSADNVQKIELLTNPSAKYDADGGAGIINLVLKKNESQGTNGSASVSFGYGYGQKETVSLNLNHRTGNTNYFGTYAFSNDDTYSNWRGIGTSVMSVFDGKTAYDFKSQTEQNNKSHNLQLGMEREMSESLFAGATLMYNHSVIKNDVLNEADYWFANDPFMSAQININGQNTWDNLNATFYAEKTFSEKSKLKLDADYLYYSNNYPTVVYNEFFDENGQPFDPSNAVFVENNRGESGTDIQIGVLKMDWEKTLNDKINIETGVKGSYSETSNFAIIEEARDGEWGLDPRNKTESQIDEIIGAAYASLYYSLDSNTNITLGARYEHWTRDFGDPALDQNSGKLFPSLFINRKLTSNTSLQFVYNRRISRPSYNDLAANLTYNSPTSVLAGNPYLQPTIADNLRLSYLIKDINIALVYTHETNPIVRYQVSELKDTELAVIAPQNMTYQKNFALQTNIPLQLFSWWSVNVGGSVGIREFQLSHTKEQVVKDYFAYNTYGSNTFSLPFNITAEISGFYNSDHYYGSMKAQGFGQMNIGLKKNLKDNKGSFQFSITDVFETMQYENELGTLTEEAYNSQFNVIFRPESGDTRIYRLTYSKTFGNTKLKGKKQRQGGSNEEKSRVNKG
ncbi:TonB-dependent receptor [Flammeovirgaceae bacterium SG7u.111]|nr:TonB-dependent receptor [Flammeovirgaceae bacterium SG7u.132]WPO33610.1 TonB-dependent receptor [Flammeovirgaceae bacterium SG7u.111]